ncbi:MAG: hypothetical protein CBD27_07655 [Rhodospirillaceae bacterium TMED167]|nr:hypothetical protein [Rhodospirillaceae bacterium]OUW26677.1 MAG: hypothetical protein CBD27_07655 [Rhodospirillaceae bacterium TMED167]
MGRRRLLLLQPSRPDRPARRRRNSVLQAGAGGPVAGPDEGLARKYEASSSATELVTLRDQINELLLQLRKLMAPWRGFARRCG